MNLPRTDITESFSASGFEFLGWVGGVWRRLVVKYIRRVDQTVNEQTGTSYTLQASDLDGIVRLSNAAAIALTVGPIDIADWPIGGEVMLIRGNGGSGQITVGAGSGQTVRSSGTKLKFNGQYAVCFIRRITATEWFFYGDTLA